VQVIQNAEQLEKKMNGLSRRQLVVLGDHLAKRHAIDVLHDEKSSRQTVPDVAKPVVHLRHAMVTQRAKHGRLTLEQLVRFPVGGPTAIEYLERDRPLVRSVMREKRPPERTVSKLPHELVTAGDCLPGGVRRMKGGHRARI
jgi:hypothetical protein